MIRRIKQNTMLSKKLQFSSAFAKEICIAFWRGNYVDIRNFNMVVGVWKLTKFIKCSCQSLQFWSISIVF